MASKPKKHKQTINRPKTLIETEYFPFEKKTGPLQIRTQDLCHPSRIRYLQAKCARNAKKFEFYVSQGESCEQSYLREKLLEPDYNNLADHKGKDSNRKKPRKYLRFVH